MTRIGISTCYVITGLTTKQNLYSDPRHTNHHVPMADNDPINRCTCTEQHDQVMEQIIS